MKVNQKYLADQGGVTQQMISAILCGKARPSWKLTKRLAAATGTSPILWLDGSPDEIRAALDGCCEDKAA